MLGLQTSPPLVRKTPLGVDRANMCRGPEGSGNGYYSPGVVRAGLGSPEALKKGKRTPFIFFQSVLQIFLEKGFYHVESSRKRCS
jgi:hypothetical protein